MNRYFAVLLCCLLSSAAVAAPATVIRFLAPGSRSLCFQVMWRDQVLFYNSTATSLTVRITGISNGEPDIRTPDMIVVPPLTVVSLNTVIRNAWIPEQFGLQDAKLWMLHLDVPSGITIQSRDEYTVFDSCIAGPQPGGAAGQVPMPVFRSATPANVSQVHLGTDTGSVKSRINVGIYNASSVPANAHIVVRRVCDGTITDTRDVTIPPDTVVQTGNLEKGEDICSAPGPQWIRYTTVTVDQSSMTFASSLTERDNGFLGLAPQNGLTVPINTAFE
jgi:hypothetical protein